MRGSRNSENAHGDHANVARANLQQFAAKADDNVLNRKDRIGDFLWDCGTALRRRQRCEYRTDEPYLREPFALPDGNAFADGAWQIDQEVGGWGMDSEGRRRRAVFDRGQCDKRLAAIFDFIFGEKCSARLKKLGGRGRDPHGARGRALVTRG